MQEGWNTREGGKRGDKGGCSKGTHESRGGGEHTLGAQWTGESGGKIKRREKALNHTLETRGASTCTARHLLLLWKTAALGNWEGLQTPPE